MVQPQTTKSDLTNFYLVCQLVGIESAKHDVHQRNSIVGEVSDDFAVPPDNPFAGRELEV
ncbi:hypothetical protein D3C76_1633410 [compost metagenome]